MKILFILSLFLLTLSCASTRYSSRTDAYRSSRYHKKELLKTSLFSKGDKPMSEVDIQKVLQSRIKIKKSNSLAVVKVDEGRSFVLNKELKKAFFDKVLKSKKVNNTLIVPSLLIGPDVNLIKIRESAARMQSELLVILKSSNIVDFDYNVFSKNRIRTVSTVEAFLLDVRTGVIPFTSVVSESNELEETKEDISRDQLIRRGITNGENKALSRIAIDLVQFIDTFQ